MWHEWREAMFGAELQVERRVRHVAQHCARRGVLARATPVKQRVSHYVAAHEDGVEHVIHAGQDMRVRHERRVNRNLNARAILPFALAPRRSTLDRFDDSEQLDGVAELFGKLDIQRADVPDAFDVNLLRVHPETVRERSEDADLVLRIPAVNVEIRRRFGITLLLRVLEHRIEVRTFELHAREDVIAGAVDDPVEGGDAVADKTFAQRLDDRYAAANAGFVIEVRAVVARGRKQFLTVFSEQRLVGRDDRFAELERREDHRLREARAADEFDDDVRLRVIDDALPVGRYQAGWDFVRARFVERLDGDFAHVDFDANAGG